MTLCCYMSTIIMSMGFTTFRQVLLHTGYGLTDFLTEFVFTPILASFTFLFLLFSYAEGVEMSELYIGYTKCKAEKQDQ